MPPAAFAVGDDVEADLRGRGYRPGTIAAAHADRTYCVAYDDDVEDRVPADRVWGDVPDYGCAAYDDRVDAAVRAGAVLFPKRSPW